MSHITIHGKQTLSASSSVLQVCLIGRHSVRTRSNMSRDLANHLHDFFLYCNLQVREEPTSLLRPRSSVDAEKVDGPVDDTSFEHDGEEDTSDVADS